MTKKDYRSFFAQCKPMLKMVYFLRIAKISQASFSRFMSGPEYDWILSIEALNRLYLAITDACINIA